MQMELFRGADLDGLRRAGRVAAATLAATAAKVRAGITTADLDAFVREDTRRREGIPSQLGYHGFPAAVCTSRNHVVCHGIPSEKVRLTDGDILNIDVTTMIGGFHGDTSMMVQVGTISREAAHVVETARRCRDAGIQVIRPGARLGDIAHAVSDLAKQEGCSVVREYGGHGIGRHMHTDPHVGFVGKPGTGLRLRAGMVITVEPMINLGGPEVQLEADGWTVTTKDGSLSAQFEHTVLVTDTGHEILTQVP